MAKLDAAIEPTIFDAPIKYSMADMARIAGTTVENVFTMTRQIGSSPRDADAVHYTDLDLAAVQDALAFAESEEIDQEALGTLLRGMGFLMERLTTRQVESVIHHNEQKYGVSDTEARLLAAEQSPQQAEKVLRMLGHVYRRHLAISTRRLTVDTIAQRGLLSSEADYPLVRAIGFADLVNFTARTEKVSPKEFSEIIKNFRETAWDIINRHRGRTINYIGDAVFFVADTIEEGAEMALQLAAPGVFGISGEMRVGLAWSRVVAIYGDAYGPGVNLASRLSSASHANEVYVDASAAKLLRTIPEFSVQPEPEFEAHGIGTVHPYRLRYTDDPRGV